MKSLILIGIDTTDARRMLGKAGNKDQAMGKALKKAVKETAKQARERLAKQAQKSYTVKNAGFNKNMKIRIVSGSHPAAIIRSDGEPLPLKEFKTSKAGKTTRAQVLKHGTLKPLERGGIKAFINNIADKNQVRKRDTKKGKAGSSVRHIAVAQRSGKDRLEINEKFSNSIPVMIGSQEHVYGVVEPNIGEDLQNYLHNFVKQALEDKMTVNELQDELIMEIRCITQDMETYNRNGDR